MRTTTIPARRARPARPTGGPAPRPGPRPRARGGDDRAARVAVTALVVLAMLVVIVLPAITPPVVGYLLAGAIAVSLAAALAPGARRYLRGSKVGAASSRITSTPSNAADQSVVATFPNSRDGTAPSARSLARSR